MSQILLVLPLVVAMQDPPGSDTDWIIPAGVTVLLAGSDIRVHDLVIESGATLRLAPHRTHEVDPFFLFPLPSSPLHVRASGTIRIDGTLDVSGYSAIDVTLASALNRRNIGGPETAGGQKGGTGNPRDWTYCAAGYDGGFDRGELAFGNGRGRGGESGVGTANSTSCRPGGGGGGALAADQPVHPDPNDAANVGRIAQAGRDGGASAFGAVSLLSPPPGGSPGASAFVDGVATNDFFGSRRDPITQAITVGELLAPMAGSGGGGGGNHIRGSTFPPAEPWNPHDGSQHAGGGGGAGGGLAILESVFIVLGPNGRIVCNGGDGASGENTNGNNRIGGGGGGGSGGMILMQARRVDLRQASANAITALGGRGGRGADNVFGATCGGGNGGPGLIQIHVPNELTNLALPQNLTLADITAPTAHVLLPVAGL